MSDDVKDAGLVAMISSILGGGKRADIVAPPPLTEGPPTAPTNAFDPVEAPIPAAAPVKPDDHASDAAPAVTKPVEPAHLLRLVAGEDLPLAAPNELG